MKYIAVHCAATDPSQDIGAADIDRWHRQKGWFGIGYHFVIRRDGTLETGRDLSRPGAHVYGHNHESVGVCLAGGVKKDASRTPEDNFTPYQKETLKVLLERLQVQFPKAHIQGHRDFPGVAKACPSFDVAEWLQRVGIDNP